MSKYTMAGVSSRRATQLSLHRRGQQGQAIVEGACVMVVMTALIVGGTLLLLGTGMACYYKVKLTQVTDAAARQAINERFWLGAQRPDYSPANVQQKVKATVNTMLRAIGLPEAAVCTLDQSSSDVVTVRIKVAGLSILSGGILPSAIAMEDVSCQPYVVERPIAVVGIGFNEQGTGRGLYFPSYGAGENTPGPTSFPQGRFPYYNPVYVPTGSINGPRQNNINGGAFRGY